MNYQLIDVTMDDLATLQQVGRDTFYETYADDSDNHDLKMYLQDAFSIKHLATEVNNPESYFKFIFYNDQLAGYLKINLGSAQTEAEGTAALEIERIYIQRAFRYHGLGTKVIEYAVKQAQCLHKQFIWLGVWEHNEPAKHFYAKMGFEPFSEHQFTLGKEFQRDILMKKLV